LTGLRRELTGLPFVSIFGTQATPVRRQSNDALAKLEEKLVSVLKHDLALKRLRKLLSIAQDEQFFLLIWAIDAIQSGKESEIARAIMTYPKEAVTTDVRSRYFVHKWKMETLLNELLVTPKQTVKTKKTSRYLNCKSFDGAVGCLIALGKLENADDALALKRVNVLSELHRIGQRQFEWQRGFYSHAQLYRAIFIFGHQLSAAYFKKSYGLTIDQFIHFGFALYTVFDDAPGLMNGAEFENVGITNAIRDAGLRRLCASITEIRVEAARLRIPLSSHAHVSYRPSILRSVPCVAFGDHAERIRAPLPALILWRTTAGLYYDVIRAGAEVRNEIGACFEKYATNLLQAMLPSFTVSGSYKYQVRSNLVDTPDIFISKNDSVILAIECKAKKMTLGAKFAELPIDEESGYQEIIKGVFQLWRFFSHHRQGLIHGLNMEPTAIGIVLTLDPWLQMSLPLRRSVIAEANTLSDKSAHKITDADRRPVVFCAIDDLEDLLRIASGANFVLAMQAAVLDKYHGWTIANVHRDISDERLDQNYPFTKQLEEELPWLKLLRGQI
jgi:hypothetical protein